MVRIAIAGGSGEVAREICDALVAVNKHEIILLTRKQISAVPTIARTRWISVDYANTEHLREVLDGVGVVLSFITPQTDPGSQAQKNLIDAAIAAGVHRFAPSEWATSSFEYMEWYAGKAEIRDYLDTVNKSGKVLEYTLFQPGLFLNYLTHPHRSATHVNTFETQFDFHNRRAIVPNGCENAKITLTAVQDVANIVVQAVEYEGDWPQTGGVKGCEISIAELIQLAEDIRGDRFAVERLEPTDLRSCIIKSTWRPKVTHAAIPREDAEALADMLLAGMTLGISVGALNVSNEWNQTFPEYEFVQPHQFLSDVWKDKP